MFCDDPSFVLPRGVWRAPLYGPNGERIYFAVDSQHRLVNQDRVYVLPGDNPEPAKAMLWELLNTVDPIAAVEQTSQSA